MALLGQPVGSCDDGGGIDVKGDTTINNTGLGTLGTVLVIIALILAMLLAGAGAAVLYAHCNKPTTTIVDDGNGTGTATQNWRLSIRVTDTP